ncbi:radial spoke head 10 homolog B [Lampris incognitus]|uniref:radial spoke head 10 homolog B n=1 Tax=Lampris incognitus TaxID=2546036 RepID=UPI0024B5234A|nr:radial spoke head 10 homolog B [Lampris incognitus]
MANGNTNKDVEETSDATKSRELSRGSAGSESDLDFAGAEREYEGGKSNERLHGEGVAYFQGGSVYKGMFSEGLMHGRGEYTWEDGVKYQGEFVSNTPMGRGVYTWLDGSSYQGQVHAAVRHGVGSHKCADSSVVYRGQWHHGKRHGKGIIYYNQDATSWYEGEWVNNNRQGWGVRRYPSGNVYEGVWQNNSRHGDGTMRWLNLGQEYSGTWQDGAPHGEGTYTWFLRRIHGTQYPQRNEYQGEFCRGKRHGLGTFYYASGALYRGEWRNDKKHGQGKFIFKNGRVFEGEFVDDHMAEFPSFHLDDSKSPNLSGIRTCTPLGKHANCEPLMLGADMALDIDSLLEKFPKSRRETELKQLEFVVLRHIGELRSIYSLYSSLGRGHSPDNTFLLSRLQLWRLLKDCHIHHHGTTLVQIDRLISADDLPSDEIHSPFSSVLPRKLLSALVTIAHHAYHEDQQTSHNILAMCFSKMMKENILPNAKNVKGHLFSNVVHAVVAGNYIERCWVIYRDLSMVSSALRTDHTVTCRHLVWMFKDLGLFDSNLTTRRLLEIMTAEELDAGSRSHCNLDQEITFLEFFEVLLGCSQVSSQPAVCSSLEVIGSSPEEGASESLLLSQSLLTQSMGKFSHIQQVSTPEDMKGVNLQTAVHIQSQTAETTTHLSSSESGELSSQRDSVLQATPTSYSPRLTSNADVTGCRSGQQNGDEGKMLRVESTEAQDGEPDVWIRRCHRFFSRLFPVYDHERSRRRHMEEERLRHAVQKHAAVAKAREQARLREQWEAEEEERRQKEAEKEEAAAERVDGNEDEVIGSPSEVSTSSVTVAAAAKQASRSRKKQPAKKAGKRA